MYRIGVYILLYDFVIDKWKYCLFLNLIFLKLILKNPIHYFYWVFLGKILHICLVVCF